MTGDTSTLVIQFVFLAAIIFAPWFYRRSKRVRLGSFRSGLKNKLPDSLQSGSRRDRKSEILARVETGSPKSFPCVYRKRLTMHASQARRRILGHKHCNCRRDDLVFSQSGLRTGSIFEQVRDTTVQVWTD